MRLVWKRRYWFAVPVLLALVAYVVFWIWGDELMRRRMEENINDSLVGYTARVPELDFHLIGLSVTLKNAQLSQQSHPDPPVAQFGKVHASVQWKALLHGRLVADFEFDNPKLHIDLRQLESEVKDPTNFEDKGWQDAARDIYPLKINHFAVNNGEVTYIDKDAKRPLELRNVQLRATNIRNVRSPDNVYPSTISMTTDVFGSGRLEVEGRANFLSEPHVGLNVDFKFAQVPLAALNPVAGRVNLRVRKGILDAAGHLEYSPEVENVRIENATLRGVQVDYLHLSATQKAEAERLATVQKTAKRVSNEPNTLVFVDHFEIADSTIAYSDSTQPPGYRLFLSDADMTLKDLSNQASEKPAQIDITGLFMGSGRTQIVGSFMPIHKTPYFDFSVRIQNTSMKSMNDLFRSLADFDVAKGEFAFYSELHARDGRLRGYVKPLMSDVEVFKRQQDKSKSILQQVYEALIGGVAGLLKSKEGKVATETEVSGRIDDPNVQTWEAVANLLKNAFVSAIRPGLTGEEGKKG